MIKEYRVNQRIRAKEVRLIGQAGEQLGVVPLIKALQMASERNIDLVEVAPQAVPPVCRLLDYGKFRYEQTKKEREARKRQKAIELSQVRMRPRTDAHDVESKIKIAQKLLEKGNKVKVLVIFRGREIVHPDLGVELLAKITKMLDGIAQVERPLMREGNNMSIIFSQIAQKSKSKDKVNA